MLAYAVYQNLPDVVEQLLYHGANLEQMMPGYPYTLSGYASHYEYEKINNLLLAQKKRNEAKSLVSSGRYVEAVQRYEQARNYAHQDNLIDQDLSELSNHEILPGNLNDIGDFYWGRSKRETALSWYEAAIAKGNREKLITAGNICLAAPNKDFLKAARYFIQSGTQVGRINLEALLNNPSLTGREAVAIGNLKKAVIYKQRVP